MASKSDSPNMVAHPENYVKYDVIFREGAACFKQAFALPYFVFLSADTVLEGTVEKTDKIVR